MAPNTSARNASPAPRAAKKVEESKENNSQNLIRIEHEQPSEKPLTTLSKNVSKRLVQDGNEEEPQKQGKLATLQRKAGTTVWATGRSLASACCNSVSLVCSIFHRSKASLVEAVSGISHRSKASLMAFMMILIALVAFMVTVCCNSLGAFSITYSIDFAGEFAAGMQKVASQIWSATSRGLTGFAINGSEASVDL